MKLRVRPQGDYPEKASLEDLHKITLEWDSEIKFWKDELHFFQHLIDKYVLKMIEEDQLQHIQKIVDEIIQYSDVDLKDISEKVQKHNNHLGLIIEDKFSYDQNLIRREHAHLEDSISVLMEKFKSFKKDIFSVIEEVLKNEKLQHLLQR